MCLDDQADSGQVTTLSAYCNTSNGGCWTVKDDSHATASVLGSFGYGANYLGDVKLQANFSLNGAQVTSTSVSGWSNTKLYDVNLESDLLHGDPSGPGYTSNQKFNKSYGNLTANTYLAFNNYSSYDKSYVYHANVHEMSWEEISYPYGYWYAIIKSPVAHDLNNNDIYVFTTVDDRYDNSAAGGFRSY